jgi:hypothetical protein
LYNWQTDSKISRNQSTRFPAACSLGFGIVIKSGLEVDPVKGSGPGFMGQSGKIKKKYLKL